jgi:hypothetical protein
MAKRKPTGATAAAQRVFGGDRERLAGLPKNKSVVVGIRLSPALRAQLVAYFRARETDLSTGLRGWIVERVKQEGLR